MILPSTPAKQHLHNLHSKTPHPIPHTHTSMHTSASSHQHSNPPETTTPQPHPHATPVPSHVPESHPTNAPPWLMYRVVTKWLRNHQRMRGLEIHRWRCIPLAMVGVVVSYHHPLLQWWWYGRHHRHRHRSRGAVPLRDCIHDKYPRFLVQNRDTYLDSLDKSLIVDHRGDVRHLVRAYPPQRKIQRSFCLFFGRMDLLYLRW